jgi:hypothetical protein
MTSANPPLAFMGYKAMNPRTGRVIVRVCAYCPDKEQADAEARSADQEVSHGICVTCYAKQTAALTGEVD